MEVRLTSRSGKLLYSGTLEQGQRKSFEGRSLQLALAEPDNVAVRVNGQPRGSARGHDVRRHRAEDRPGTILSRPRAAIVVTGSELVRGERQDRNGPFLAAEVVRLGLDATRIAIVGDRVEDLERAFREDFEADLASSRVASVRRTTTAQSTPSPGSPAVRSVLDEALEQEIGAISRTIAERLGRSYAEFTSGVRKQATLPAGAISLGLAGTAPGVVLDIGECVVVVLPGPPRELQRLWPRALETAPVQRVLRGAVPGRCAAPRAAVLRDARVGRRRGAGGRRRRGTDRRHDLRT